MTQETTNAIIVAIPATLVAVSTLLQSLKNGRRIQELHLQINSRMTQWFEEAKVAARAEGHGLGLQAIHNRRRTDRK